MNQLVHVETKSGMSSGCPELQQAPIEADSGSIGVSIKIALIKMSDTVSVQHLYNNYTLCVFFIFYVFLGFNPKEFDLVTITTQQ